MLILHCLKPAIEATASTNPNQFPLAGFLLASHSQHQSTKTVLKMSTEELPSPELIDLVPAPLPADFESPNLPSREPSPTLSPEVDLETVLTRLGKQPLRSWQRRPEC
jgi:hypothetical protein